MNLNMKIYYIFNKILDNNIENNRNLSNCKNEFNANNEITEDENIIFRNIYSSYCNDRDSDNEKESKLISDKTNESDDFKDLNTFK